MPTSRRERKVRPAMVQAREQVLIVRVPSGGKIRAKRSAAIIRGRSRSLGRFIAVRQVPLREFGCIRGKSSVYAFWEVILCILSSPSACRTVWNGSGIALIVVLLFGADKLPKLARGLGKSLGEFKKAKEEFEKEIHSADIASRRRQGDSECQAPVMKTLNANYPAVGCAGRDRVGQKDLSVPALAHAPGSSAITHRAESRWIENQVRLDRLSSTVSPLKFTGEPRQENLSSCRDSATRRDGHGARHRHRSATRASIGNENEGREQAHAIPPPITAGT